jgi:hypothetical protein
VGKDFNLLKCAAAVQANKKHLQYFKSLFQVHNLSSTSTSPCAVTTRLRPHAFYVDLAVRHDYSSPAAHALRRPRRAPRLLVSGCTRSTSTSPCAATTRLRLHALYVNLVVHREYSSPLSRLQRSTSTTPRVRGPRHVAHRAARRRLLRARRRLLHLHRASGCLGTSRGSSRRSSSTIPGSSSTTSPPPRVRVPRHVACLVTWLVAGFVVDYSVHHNFLLRPHWLYFSHVVRRDYLSRGNTGSTTSTPRATTTSSPGRIASTIHLD